MRRVLLLKVFGVVGATVLLLSVLAVYAMAQENEGLLPFPTSSATITLTDSGLEISPSQLNPGSVIFTVNNQSSESRGVYVTGLDRVGDPIIRYSEKLMPGSSGTMIFWLYEGQQFTFQDYTVRSGLSFDSTYSSTVTIPNVLPLGSGPKYDWMMGSIVISNDGISVTPQTSDHGPIVFNVVNNSDMARGVVIKGDDRTGSPIFRYSRLLQPGDRATVNFWLYEGKSYAIHDYSSAGMVSGAPAYSSVFSTTLTVNPGTPAAGS